MIDDESIFDTYEKYQMYPQYFVWKLYSEDIHSIEHEIICEGELMTIDENEIIETYSYVMTMKSLFMIMDKELSENTIAELSFANPRIKKIKKSGM